nr:GcrA family cell cycle regulator [Candidatus Kirkpatrickella diaphorinae]
MEWTNETIARLQELWQQGLSTAEIGRQLNITKNAVVGKAHRLGLPPRPSPIRSGGRPAKSATASKEKPSRSAAKATQPKKVSAPAETPASGKKPVKASPPAPKSVSATPVAPKQPAPVSTRPAPSAPDGTASARSAKAAPAKAPSAPSVTAKAPAATPPKVSAAEKALTEKELRPLLKPLNVDSGIKRGPSCCWPFGDPGTPEFRFCGAKPVPGKPYCAEHCAVAYVKLRDRRDNSGN